MAAARLTVSYVVEGRTGRTGAGKLLLEIAVIVAKELLFETTL